MRWKEAASLAAMQFGLIALWQARELGITRQELDSRVRRHGWKRVRAGVYLLPGHTLTQLGQLKAAELAFVGEGVAAGRAGAFAWELLTRLYRPLDFIVVPGCARQPSGTRVRESAWLLGNDTTLRRGITVPTVEWTIVTCGPWSPVPELKRMIVIADRKRLCPRSAVRDVVAAHPTAKGRRFLVQALDELDGTGMAHSELEGLGRRHLRRARLRPHGRPHLVIDDKGGRVGEIDIPFIDEKVGICIDGPHHFEPDQKRADDDQRHRLELMGWHIIAADEHRLKHQREVFVRQVREALDARRGVPGFPS